MPQAEHRPKTTDERLDALEQSVTTLANTMKAGFEATDRHFAEVRGDLRVLTGRVDDLRTDTDGLRTDLTSYQKENRRAFERMSKTMDEGFAIVADHLNPLEHRLGGVTPA
jgi:outer membrane murein-binding lipoprotein Lpp